MIRVEFRYWTKENGYSHNETVDNIDDEITAQEYVNSLEDNGILNNYDGINVELYDEEDELISEYFWEKDMKTMKTYNPKGKKYGVYSADNRSVDYVFDTEEDAQEFIEDMKDEGEQMEVVRLSDDIRNIRSMTGLSQAKFAAHYNIPKRTLESWEMGERECPVYVLELLRRAVNEDFGQK